MRKKKKNLAMREKKKSKHRLENNSVFKQSILKFLIDIRVEILRWQLDVSMEFGKEINYKKFTIYKSIY